MTINDDEAAYNAVEHLINIGKKRIAIIKEREFSYLPHMRFLLQFDDTGIVPLKLLVINNNTELPCRDASKKTPSLGGRQVLRQVSYRQETYRAVRLLYNLHSESPSKNFDISVK